MGLNEALKAAAAEVEAAIEDLLPVPEGSEARLLEAMRYSTLGGGKRMRAFLVMETARLFRVDRGAGRGGGGDAARLFADP